LAAEGIWSLHCSHTHGSFPEIFIHILRGKIEEEGKISEIQTSPDLKGQMGAQAKLANKKCNNTITHGFRQGHFWATDEEFIRQNWGKTTRLTHFILLFFGGGLIFISFYYY
jgi:hypothetical protein